MKLTTDQAQVSAHTNGNSNGINGNGKVLVSASRMIGNEVFNRKEQSIGSVREFILNSETGDPQYVVVSSGGFLGFGERLHAIPWKALSLDTANQWFMLNVDAESLSDAPALDKDNWPEITNADWIGQTNAWYASKGQNMHRASPDV